MSKNRPTFSEHDFRKATLSEPDRDCVQVARKGNWVEIRDDKKLFGAPDDVRLALTAEQFDTFQRGVRTGTTTGHPLHIQQRADGTYILRNTTAPPALGALQFTSSEVTAFLDGVAKHEFDLVAYTA